MFSPLLSSLIEQHGYPVIGEADLAAFANARDHCVLFFAGDADRLMESNDLAVILPELIKASAGVLAPIIVSRDAERMLQRKYRFSAFPALVFLRRGEYLGAISRVRDWAEYMREIPEILARAPSEPPPFKLPGRSASVEHDHLGN
ncbi:MAG: hydrogenase-1 expression HyaE [Hyphomicrobiaceae bacterium]|nr:hydrogenase-1 expression HyaE [Hyphomicrobiaceae bacterium]